MKTPLSKSERFSQWVNARFPWNKFMDTALYEEIHGGASYFYIFGSMLIFLLVIQVITGIFMMMYYVPTVTYAYQSLSYMRMHVPFGWLVYNIHYWGANLFTIVVGLHMIRVFIWGAYKKPREMIWLIGIVLVLITAGFMFTGPILAWNKMGYWAGEVGLSMAGPIPIFGRFVQSILQGSTKLGQITLTRLYTFHVMLLFGLIILFIGIHIIAFRQQGSSGSWDQVKRKILGLFWPDQIFKDTIAIFIVFLLLIGLSVFFPPSFYGLADPQDTFFHPKPAWPFLFLYQILKFFKGRWEPVGIVGVPTVIILLLVLLPFLDRSEERNPRKRPFIMACGFIFVTFVLTMLIIGYRSKPGATTISTKSSAVSLQGITSQQGTVQQNPSHSSLAEVNLVTKKVTKKISNVPKTGKTINTTTTEVLKGEKIFNDNCSSCHTAIGKPSHKAGPDLILALRKKERSEKWLYTQLVSPEKHNPYTIMPSFSYLGKAKISALVSFLKGLETKKITQVPSKVQQQVSPKTQQRVSPKVSPEILSQADSIIGSISHGKVLFDNFCLRCHGPQGKTYAAGFHHPPGVPPLNPIARDRYSSNPQKFVNKIDVVIQHGLPNPANGPNMPAFGDTHSLTQPEISDIEAYVLHINNVDRHQIVHPGVRPRVFFFLVLELAILMVIFLLVYRWIRKVSV